MNRLILLLIVFKGCSLFTENETHPPIVQHELKPKDVSLFFRSDGDIIDENIEFFLDGNELPIYSIPLGKFELKFAKYYKFKGDFKILCLYNPMNETIDLFYKGTRCDSSEIVENKYLPDEISCNQLNDTIFILQYYWKYNFGSNLEHIKTYYFLSKNMGLFKYGYNCSGNKSLGLNLNSFKIKNEFVLIGKSKGSGIIKVLPDSIIDENATHSFLVKPKIIPYNKLLFSKH